MFDSFFVKGLVNSSESFREQSDLGLHGLLKHSGSYSVLQIRRGQRDI